MGCIISMLFSVIIPALIGIHLGTLTNQGELPWLASLFLAVVLSVVSGALGISLRSLAEDRR